MKRLLILVCIAAALVVPATAHADTEYFHSGWLNVGETPVSTYWGGWQQVSFCCKNKNKNTTYALVYYPSGSWACGGGTIAVEGGCSNLSWDNKFGYIRNTGTEGYSLTAWVSGPFI